MLHIKELYKKEHETDSEYIYRICEMKDSIGTWEEVANIINDNLETNYDESCFRKKFQSYNKFKNEISSNKIDEVDREHIELLREEQDKLYKQQVKTRDAVREYRNDLRTDARIEVLREALRNDEEKYNPVFRPYNGFSFDGNKTAILNIGDWHCGDEVHNFYNDFNLSILENRVQRLCDQTIKYCQLNHVTTLNVINLSDMIQGQIHVTCRIQNELDSIQQVKQVSRLIYSLLTKLAENIEQVTYRSVLDNHSRINNNPKEHIEKESFVKLIDWWLEDKIKFYNEKYKGTYKNPILMCFDNIDDNIGYLKVDNKNIFFTHGHLGSANTVLQDLTFATGIVADIVIMGHWHVDKVKDFQGRKVYFNGTLKGTDDYALNKRLFGHPSQTLLIFDEDNVINIPIQFK